MNAAPIWRRGRALLAIPVWIVAVSMLAIATGFYWSGNKLLAASDALGGLTAKEIADALTKKRPPG